MKVILLYVAITRWQFCLIFRIFTFFSHTSPLAQRKLTPNIGKSFSFSSSSYLTLPLPLLSASHSHYFSFPFQYQRRNFFSQPFYYDNLSSSHFLCVRYEIELFIISPTTMVLLWWFYNSHDNLLSFICEREEKIVVFLFAWLIKKEASFTAKLMFMDLEGYWQICEIDQIFPYKPFSPIENVVKMD